MNDTTQPHQAAGFLADFSTFLSWEATTHDVMDVKKIYFDIAGDIHAGLILAELIYWYLPNKNGESKLRIKRDGHEWIVVPRYEWWERCRLSPRQADRALATLKKAGLIITERFRYNNSPTTHIRLNGGAFLERWQRLAKEPPQNPFLPNGENGNSPNGENANSPDGENARSHQTVKTMISPNGELELTKRGELITETTAETTPETTAAAATNGESESQGLAAAAAAAEPAKEADSVELAGTKHPEPAEQAAPSPPPAPTERPNAFALFEDNISPLTPIIAEELGALLDEHPASWVEDAIREAARSGGRNVKYVAAILSRWQAQGKDQGRNGGSHANTRRSDARADRPAQPRRERDPRRVRRHREDWDDYVARLAAQGLEPEPIRTRR